MTTSQDLSFDDCCQTFAASYEFSNLPAMRDIERTVLGCDYGGTSWTTRAQARQIVDMLGLQPGLRVLEIGAGSGWPGLFLADNSGCDVTLLDLPVSALAKAKARADLDGIGDRVSTFAGSGAALPFRDGSFEAISHSDVLCCLPEKMEMLRECRRVAADQANMLFSVIAVAPGLTEGDHEKAVETGPPFVAAPGDYADMLAECGWRLVDRTDCTAEYVSSLIALVAGFTESAELSELLGQDVLREACNNRQQQIAMIDAGMLVREIFLVTAD